MLSPSYIILRIQRLEANSVDLDEVAHHEPPHQDPRCLQIHLYSSLVLKEVIKACLLAMASPVILYYLNINYLLKKAMLHCNIAKPVFEHL